MYITCLDMEGVLTPEIWIEFSKESGIPELTRTTRDEPDYNKLMYWRLGILKEHGLGLKEIQDTISRIDVMPGAREFLDELRQITQVIILSDTFTEFARPIMEKLEITYFSIRIEDQKTKSVAALQSIGFQVIASGDSYNDLGMIEKADEGFLFRTTDAIKAAHPELKAFQEYDEVLAEVRDIVSR